MIIGIWGQAGAGNSTIAVALGKYLTKNGTVLIVDTKQLSHLVHLVEH